MIWFKIAARNIARHRRRSYLTMAIVVVATMALLASYSYLSSTLYNVREGTIEGGVGHLQIAHSAVFEDKADTPLAAGLDTSTANSIISAIKQIDGTRLLLPRTEFEALISNGNRTLFVQVNGVNPVEERRLSRGRIRIVEGRDFDPLGRDQPEAVIIGKGLADLLNVGPGDYITLLGPTVDGALNALDVTVLGISESGTPQRDRSYLLMHIDLAQEFLTTDRINRFVVALDDTRKTQRAKRDASTAFAAIDPTLAVRDWEELTPFYSQLVEVYQTQFWVLGLILVSVGLISSLNAMTMSVLERTREIGTLRAVGIRRSQIRAIFLWEGALVGAIGALVGGVVFLAFSLVTIIWPIEMPPPPNRDVGYPLSFALSFPALAVITAIFAGCGVAAAYWVVRRVLRQTVREALDHA